MNIGVVVHHFDSADGTGGYAVELVNRLARKHAITLYTSAVRAEVADGVAVVRVPALGGSAYARILSFPSAFATLRRKHDVVHAQGWVTGSADVITTHIVLDAWRAAARRAGVSSPPGERFLGGFVAARERALIRRAAAVIAPSRMAADDIAHFEGRVRNVRVIHHGFPMPGRLPPRKEARTQLGLPADGFIALYVGDARKGFDRAAAGLVNAPAVRLVVASRSRPDEYLSRARTLGVADRIHWIGALGDVRPAYAAADVLLHPTIYDTFAMVVAEAMTYGIPAIVSPKAGISELITHRESAWVLKPDLSDVAESLVALQSDAALAQHLSERGRMIAASRSWDDVAAETTAVYDEAARR